MRSAVALLAFAASAFAYQVTQPTNATGWTITGPNVVSWDMVSTDQSNFTILLVNQFVTPPTSQILDALVDGNLGNITVNPPSGGWKTGTGFQVNLVKDADNLNSILAQSPQFTIKDAVSSSTTGTVSTASAASNTLTVPAGTTASSTTDSSDALNPTTTDTTTATGTNGASSAMGMQAGLFAGLALLGAFLA